MYSVLPRHLTEHKKDSYVNLLLVESHSTYEDEEERAPLDDFDFVH